MNQLERVLRFAQSTGDKVIVTDPQGKDPMVVMPFGMYEHLIQTGRGELKNWRIKNREEQVEERLPMPDDLDLQPSVSEPNPVQKGEEPPLGEEEQFYLEPVE